MKRTIFYGTIIAGIAVMMTGYILPVNAFTFTGGNDVPYADGNPNRHPFLNIESCDAESCIIIVDADRNGCDEGDKRITLSLKAAQNAGIGPCTIPL